MKPRLALAALTLLLVPAALAAQTGYVSTFTPEGGWVSSFPVGLAESQLIRFVEQDATGRIYVGRTDNSHGTNQFNPNDQIAVFEADGSPALVIKGSTRLQDGLTFDSAGDLYFGAVVDGGALGENFVYRFTSAGAEVDSFGMTLNDYTDFVTAPGDRIFALRNNNRDIVEFTTAGVNVNSISLFGRFGRLMALDNTFSSLWTYEPTNGATFPSDVLVRYDLALNELATIDLLPYGEPRVVGLEINSAGEILALVDDGRILVFDPASGVLLRAITLERLGEASNLEIAADGSLLVSHMMPIASVLDIPTLDTLGLALLALALAALAAVFLARRRARA
jgi:hypothetical protein